METEENEVVVEPTDEPEEEEPESLLAHREVLDETVWAPEVEAQEYEMAFVKMWDEEREARGEKKFDVLAEFPVKERVTFGKALPVEMLERGIGVTKFKDDQTQSFSSQEWVEFLRSIQKSGVEIVQTEWHHSRFVPGGESTAPKSTISFKIHATRAETKVNFAVKGDLEVTWAAVEEGGVPEAASIAVEGLSLQQRKGEDKFEEFYSMEHGPDDFISAYPVLVYDLDSDGRSDIILPRWNRVYWNLEGRRFRSTEFLDLPIDIWEAGILSDFDGDGNADFVTVGKDGKPYFCVGNEEGKFRDEPVVCADIHFDMPTVVTAGDIDGDGDLDLWMTQYKLSFTNGQMPTPFYDANDGYPSYLLLNDGKGAFTEVTESAGLAPLRHRRTYSASFVDLDQDGDLDLFNVSDYAGLDIYRNDGTGKFELATESFVKDRHFFGMGHTIGDYNHDGLLDFYVIGMSSTTARRLDRLNLGREDRPDVHPMRATMGYGNRLYFGTKEGGFREDQEVAAAVARTGWSWGATSFDFDLDGDQDIYVANGHRSGDSCQDYCSTFWRHDIYTGDSTERPEVLDMFKETLKDIQQEAISWNGYEKNVLFMNQGEKPGRFVNSSFMFGGAFAFDARCVVGDDFDEDGRPDLLITESNWDGRGFETFHHVFANEIETDQPGNWFSVRLRESAGPGRSPNGAKVAITDDRGRTQTRWIVTGDSFLCQHAPVAHFGLGEAKGVNLIEVTWPGGKAERHEVNLGLNRSVTIRGEALVE